MDRDDVIARSRQALLRSVPHVRRHRRFAAYLIDRKRVPVWVEPGLFLEVFDSTVKPIILAAQQCRLSVSKEQLPEIERMASDTTGATWYQPQIARSRLKKWSEAGATPAAWLEAFTVKVKPPVNDHLRDDTVRTPYQLRAAASIIFTAKPDDVEIDLTSEAVNTPLFWWWLLCGGLMLNIPSVFLMDPAIVSAPSFWTQTINPTDFVGKADFGERFARRQTTRSTRVAMLVDPLLRLTTVAAAPTIERLYRLASETAVITNERYESWHAERDAPMATHIPVGGE